MSEDFKVIETQEALDAVIKGRIERNTRSVTEEVTKKFEGWISPDEAKKTADQIASLQKEIETGKATIADLTAKNTAYEISSAKMKIAREYGLPDEMAERLAGSSEEEYKKDAENLSKLFAKQPHHQTQPKSTEDPSAMSGVEKAFYKKNPELKGK